MNITAEAKKLGVILYGEREPARPELQVVEGDSLRSRHQASTINMKDIQYVHIRTQSLFGFRLCCAWQFVLSKM